MWRGEFYEWMGGHWEHRNKNEVEKAAIEWVEGAKVQTISAKGGAGEEALGLTAGEVKDVVWMVERLYASSATHEPFWITDAGRDGPDIDLDHAVVFRDRVIDVKATAEHRKAGGAGWVGSKATPDLFTTTTCRVKFEEGGKCERWQRCGEEWGNGQDGHFELIERVGGHALMRTRKYRRWVHQFGKSDCGKGILTNTVLKGLLPDTAFFSTRMMDLFDQFGLDGAERARVFVLTEGTHMEKGLGFQVASTIKTIIGDVGRVNIKHVRALRNVHFPCLTFVQSNGALNLPNDHGSMAKKAVVVPYTVSFNQRPDRSLHDTLTRELPGIAYRLVEAAVRLEMEEEDAKKFPVLPEAKKILDEYNEDTNPLDVFLEWGFVRFPKGFVPNEMLRRYFHAWERERGKPCRMIDDKPLTVEKLPRELERRVSWNLRCGRRKSDDTYGVYGISPRADKALR